MKALRFGLLVFALGLAALLLWSETSAPDPIAAGRLDPINPSVRLPALLTKETPANDATAVPVARTDALEDLTHEPRAREDLGNPAPKELVLAGRVELIDRDGNVRVNATGSFQLELRAPNDPSAHRPRPVTEIVRVRFENGRFRARFRRLDSGEFAFSGAPHGVSVPPLGRWIPNAGLYVGNLYLSSHPRSLELQFTTGLHLGSEAAVIRARERDAFRLHVRDAVTGLDLENVRVLPASTIAREGELPDLLNEWTRLVWDQPSPVSIPRRRPGSTRGERELSTRGSRWFVGCQGYCWTIAEFEVVDEAEHVVELHLGGSLEVQCTGPSIAPGTQIRVYRIGEPSPLASENLFRSGTTIFDGLPVGDLEVRAEHGDPWDSPHVFARSTVEVCAGLALPVLLELAPPEEPITVSVSGHLEVPSEWEALRFWMVFDREGPTPTGGSGHRIIGQTAMQQVGASDRYAFEVKGLNPGKYEVRVRPFGFSTELEVLPHGLSNLSLRVPPPVEVSIETVHSDSNRAVPASVLRWSWLPDALSADRCSGVVRKRNGESSFRFHVPAGAVTVVCETYGFQPGVLSFDARKDETYELPLRPVR